MNIIGKELNGQLLDIEEQLMGRVQELNETYHKVSLPSDVVVAHIVTDNFERRQWAFKPFEAFKRAVMEQPKVVTGINKDDSEKLEAIGKAWLEHPDASYFREGVTFYPKDQLEWNGKLNTYFAPAYKHNGKTIEENREIVKPYLKHINNVLCCEDEKGEPVLYTYVINWLAHLVQKPEEKPEVALGLLGEQGTGKGQFVKPIGKIIGSHYAQLQDAGKLTGKFNSALENKILVFGDEFFGGTNQDTDKMKGLITEEESTIERKGIDSVQVPSYSRVIIATNRDNPIRVEDKERRYCMLRVSSKYIRNMEYFGKLSTWGKCEENIEALYSYLLDQDISEFEPRVFPETAELEKMKMDALPPEKEWMIQCYGEGKLLGSGLSMAEAKEVPSTVMQQCFKEWIKIEGKEKAVKGHMARYVKAAMEYVGATQVTRNVRVYVMPRLDDAKAKIQNDIDKYY